VAAMEAAGAAFSWLDRREIAARIPFVAPPWEPGILDPLGSSLRIRRALAAALARRVDIHRAEVASVAGGGSVTLPDGTLVRAAGC
jgi:sarcosine oxidase